MSGLRSSTGNSAEDKMSNVVGCIILAALIIIACGIGATMLLIRWLA